MYIYVAFLRLLAPFTYRRTEIWGLYSMIPFSIVCLASISCVHRMSSVRLSSVLRAFIVPFSCIRRLIFSRPLSDYSLHTVHSSVRFVLAIALNEKGTGA